MQRASARFALHYPSSNKFKKLFDKKYGSDSVEKATCTLKTEYHIYRLKMLEKMELSLTRSSFCKILIETNQ